MKVYMVYFVDNNKRPISASSLVVNRVWFTQQEVLKDFDWISSEYGDKGRIAVFAAEVRLYKGELAYSEPPKIEDMTQWQQHPQQRTSELIQVSEDALPF